VTIEIRRNPDNTIDEVGVRSADLHMEDMGENGWSLTILQGDRWWIFSIYQGELILVEEG
jgi:hypothetical protein